MSKKILILGNGPSLKDVPFYTYAIPTIGMNVAYRYWFSIGWYPTYYACLDTDVTLEHHAEIYRMIIHHKRFGIRGFLLKREICQFYPELKDNPYIVFSDTITHNTFGFSKYMRKTTGSWAVRWAINMGYTRLLLMGIDCHYEPLYKEVGILTADNKITADIKNDPNYFFDGYQKKGDTMHVPAKGKESREVHIESFRHIVDDIEQINEDEKVKTKIKIYTCTKETRLYTLGIVDYRDIESELYVIGC